VTLSCHVIRVWVEQGVQIHLCLKGYGSQVLAKTIWHHDSTALTYSDCDVGLHSRTACAKSEKRSKHENSTLLHYRGYCIMCMRTCVQRIMCHVHDNQAGLTLAAARASHAKQHDRGQNREIAGADERHCSAQNALSAPDGSSFSI